MELKKIQYFLRIVEKGSLSKAAESLYLTQPTLSRFLAKLEEEAGTRLFDRGRDNSLTLTAAGRHYLETARKIDALWRGLEAELQNVRNEILLGVDSDGLFPLLLRSTERLAERYPDCPVKILRMDALEVQRQVAEGTLDLAVTAYLDEDDRLTYLPLTTSEVRLIVSPRNPLAGETQPVRPELLPRHLPFAMICEPTVLRILADRYLAQHGYEPQIRRTYSRHSSAVELIAADDELLGFSPVDYISDRIVSLPLDPPFYYRRGICLRKESSQSAALRCLIGLLREEI